MADSPPTMVLSSGRRAASREIAVEVQELQKTELDRARKAAESWRTGLAALAGLITTVSVVKGRDSITNLPFEAQLAVALLLLAALVSAALGSFWAMRAAFGLPQEGLLDTSDSDVLKLQKHDLGVKVVTDLRKRVIPAAFLTLVFLVAGIGTAWFAKEVPPAFVKVETDKGSFCGEVADSSQGVVFLKNKDQARYMFINSIKTLTVVESCSGS